MNKIKSNSAIKIAAWILSLVSIVVFVFLSLAAVIMVDSGFYDKNEKELCVRAERRVAYDISRNIAENYENYYYDNSAFPLNEIIDGKNWKYRITDENGEHYLGNYNGERATEYKFEYSTFYYSISMQEDIEKPYYVHIHVLENKTENDNFVLASKLVKLGYNMRFSIYIIIFASAAIFFSLAAFLVSSAGHKKGENEICAGICERIPFDVFTLFAIPLVILNVALIDVCSNLAETLIIFLLPVLAFIDYVFLSLWVKSLAVRIKRQELFSKMLVFRGSRACFTPVFNSFKMGKGFFRTLLFASIPCLFLLVAALILVNGYLRETVVAIWAVCSAVFIGVSLVHASKLKILCDAAEKLSQGDFSHTVETENLYGDLYNLGKNINKINEGLQIAVTDKMKSERFKTELITNVSHDLKTPLTSIINYSDLLGKLNIEDPTAIEYIEVISRQSARLKKLTEDLLEASKASTGNIKIEFSRCDLGVLLTQTVGEFSERLEAAQLTPIVTIPPEPAYALVDGKRLYRVFENLMSNICKYSLQNTRVYLDVLKEDGIVLVRFRNISREMIEVSEQDLTERFVRGDSSRNTEGSGLGLSIAKSLTELQKGNISIRVDGDLFDVTLRFAEN